MNSTHSLRRAAILIGAVCALVAVTGGDVDAATRRHAATNEADGFLGDAPALEVPATLGCSERPTSASSPLPDATLFIDPQGSYEIEVRRDWEATPGTMVAEVEAWFVAEPADGVTPNVNVLTQATPTMDLGEYLALSITQAPGFISNFGLVSAAVVEGTADELGMMEYTGTLSDVPLHFLATVAIHDQTAVVATFTAPPTTFDELRCAVEPTLLTLRSI